MAMVDCLYDVLSRVVHACMHGVLRCVPSCSALSCFAETATTSSIEPRSLSRAAAGTICDMGEVGPGEAEIGQAGWISR